MALDLNTLTVESFETEAAGDPTQWAAATEPYTWIRSCPSATRVPMTLTDRSCCIHP